MTVRCERNGDISLTLCFSCASPTYHVMNEILADSAGKSKIHAKAKLCGVTI